MNAYKTTSTSIVKTHSTFARKFIGSILLIVIAGLVCCDSANAQQPRRRTLEYKPENKTWVEQASPPPGTAAGDLHLIKEDIKASKNSEADKAIAQWLKQYGQNDAHYAELLIAKANVLISRKDFFGAHLELQSFLSQFGKTPITTEALRLEFIIAEHFLTGVKRKVLGIPMISDEDTAYSILDEISVEYPDSQYAVLAIKTKAEHLFQSGEHGLAELEYSRLLKEYPNSRYHQLAVSQSAKASLASFGGVEYDEAALIEAEDRFHEYRRAYPDAANHDGVPLILDSIRETRAEKDRLIAQYYEKTDHLSTAIYYYSQVTQKWSGTIAAQKATKRLQLLGALQTVKTSDNP